MTREEAMLVLDHARPQTAEIERQFYDDEDLNAALDMAIKALEVDVKAMREELTSFRQDMERFMLTSQKNRFDGIIKKYLDEVKE